LPKFGGADSESDCQEITPIVSGTASGKRGSPTNEEVDMNVPLMKIKRRIKIEKK